MDTVASPGLQFLLLGWFCVRLVTDCPEGLSLILLLPVPLQMAGLCGLLTWPQSIMGWGQWRGKLRQFYARVSAWATARLHMQGVGNPVGSLSEPQTRVATHVLFPVRLFSLLVPVSMRGAFHGLLPAKPLRMLSAPPISPLQTYPVLSVSPLAAGPGYASPPCSSPR